MAIITKKYDFTLLFDATNSNPNGDPDTMNMPRIDAETGIGLVSDVCLKRKIRNYVSMVKENDPGYAMYVSGEHYLNKADMDALVERGIVPEDTPLKELKSNVLKEYKKNNPDAVQLVQEAACAFYFDVRTFGAVMTSYSDMGASQIRGPVQLGFSKSIDPIAIQEISITRCAHASEKDFLDKPGTGTMGNKFIVPYGLYRVDGHISAALAEKYSRLTGAGFNEEDLSLLWEALMNMFEHDRSAARANMESRKLIIFEHRSKMGNYPAHKLFDRVHVFLKEGISAPRSYEDYEVAVDMDDMPDGVTCEMRE